MTISEMAQQMGLDWKTVNAINKFYLKHDLGQLDLKGLRILAVDEISIRKVHRYLSVSGYWLHKPDIFNVITFGISYHILKT